MSNVMREAYKKHFPLCSIANVPCHTHATIQLCDTTRFYFDNLKGKQ
ncbi:MAG: hypothetical protein HUU08_16245 [Candidatus Brocadia sp.]|nr:hypothetical protein [Candidatus Brocadia sp.]UJS17353.1 MAG: hypothetical protein L3J17_15795 [Candidatus Jettenia sp.]